MKKLLPLFIFALLINACSYTERIKDGQTAFDRLQFAEAIPMLTKEFNKAQGTEKGKKAFLIGTCYKKMNKMEEAAPWFQKAFDNQAGTKALIEYAYALKHSEDYQKAAETFISLGRQSGNNNLYKAESDNCKLAAQYLADAANSTYKVSKTTFNSAASDYAPSKFDDESILIASDRPNSLGKEKYKWTGIPFSDLYRVNTQSESIESFDLFNTEFNEGTACLSPDGKRIYFTRCGSSQKRGIDYCKIFYAIKKDDGNWSSAKIASFVEGEANFRHPALSPDGKSLLFSSDKAQGFGGYDLYMVEKDEFGTWGPMRNLGSRINTKENESFPSFHEDKLYFSSDGHPGMGGLDIFEAINEKGKWEMKENLKSPINSGGDDFGLFVFNSSKDQDGVYTENGYFSSTRKGGMGLDDIYQFDRKVIPPPVIIDTPPPPPPIDTLPIVEPPKIVYKWLLNVQVVGQQYADPKNPNSQTVGTLPLSMAKLQVRIGNENKTFTTDETGNYTLELLEETSYNFLASKAEYLNNTATFSTKGKIRDPKNPIQQFSLTITLDRLFKNVDITLPNIYYDFDKSNIRPDAEPTLNSLVTILNNNPQILKIQLSSHTDCRGNPDYNKSLSQRRAQSAVDYLIKRGIAPSRLTAKGYGKEQPEVSCACTQCSEEEHQANRRTAFRIIE